MFLIVATKTPEQIGTRIDELARHPDESLKSYRLKQDTWFAAFNGTTRELAERLGIRGGERGAGVVVSIENYSGRTKTDLWEWLRLNWPKDD
jgi:hypothetical protein